ncbi:hypothetical protein HYH03_017205 [Edaphochlamys debaryana]|uniref:Uncharacterized protein n=1 Tax=Edaphochlamys debaryana TaxID=47281 RepID=A0A835XIE3_9CHLO|nr:hypothetical protein HYH03_017205 [Edaphochlamys debaryana]|eukprot:KAG2483960.1 hypothetical protein HYH03_017205 [Edaphochlamys debaryana]
MEYQQVYLDAQRKYNALTEEIAQTTTPHERVALLENRTEVLKHISLLLSLHAQQQRQQWQQQQQQQQQQQSKQQQQQQQQAAGPDGPSLLVGFARGVVCSVRDYVWPQHLKQQ